MPKSCSPNLELKKILEVTLEGKSASQLARAYEVHLHIVKNWIKCASGTAPKYSPKTEMSRN